jgi:hypothetical protein
VAFKQLVVLPLLVAQINFLTLVALNNWWFCHYWLLKFFFLTLVAFKQLVVLPLLVAQIFFNIGGFSIIGCSIGYSNLVYSSLPHTTF